MEVATLAGGCFWCTEAIFQRLKGINEVISGYAGEGENPTYENVSTGRSGFVEAVQIKFDPKIISYEKLLDVFWATHDPTSMNKQGADTGPQYKSVIFYHNDKQKKIALESKENMEKSGKLNSKIVTEIIQLTKFYTAEQYHQNYYETNKNSNPLDRRSQERSSYCPVVIGPKLEKLTREFNDLVKE